MENKITKVTLDPTPYIHSYRYYQSSNKAVYTPDSHSLVNPGATLA